MKRKNFFFEKKKQKTFVNLDRAGFNTHGLESQKFFAALFFKKATAYYFA